MTPTTSCDQVLAAYEHAKADVLQALDEYPCAGQVYTYTRATRTYVKWQACHNGTRRQRTFPLSALEELTAGVQAHERLQTALQQLYAAAHAVRVQRIHAGTVDAPSKKNAGHGGRGTLP